MDNDNYINNLNNKELVYILKKNSTKYLITFQKKSKYIYFSKNDFEYVCLKNNLNIIKYIYNNQQNKNFNFIQSLYNSINQKNIKIFLFILKLIYKYNPLINISLKKCLYICIDYNNLKIFKFIIKKFNLNLELYFFDLFVYSIKKKNLKFIYYLIKNNLNISLNIHQNIFKNYSNLIQSIFLLNNNKILYLLLKDLNYNNQFIYIIEEVIKSNCYKSFKFLMKFDEIKNKIKKDYLKYILLTFVSNNLDILRYIINISNCDINYDLIYNQSLNNADLKIVNYLYEKNNNIVLDDLSCLSKVLKNKNYEIFIFIIQ